MLGILEHWEHDFVLLARNSSELAALESEIHAAGGRARANVLVSVQRIESEGNAWPESRLALAAALKIDASTLLSADSDSSNATRSGSDSDMRSRPRLGLVLGIVSGFIGATVGVASAWMAASEGAHSSAELGISHALLGTFYGLTCAALATVWGRFRQRE